MSVLGDPGHGSEGGAGCNVSRGGHGREPLCSGVTSHSHLLAWPLTQWAGTFFYPPGSLAQTSQTQFWDIKLYRYFLKGVFKLISMDMTILGNSGHRVLVLCNWRVSITPGQQAAVINV